MHWRWGDTRVPANYWIRKLDPMVEPSNDSRISGSTDALSCTWTKHRYSRGKG
jgi:hypothetical protein